MQSNQGNTLQALRIIDDFIDRNAESLPSVATPAVGQSRLKAELVQLTSRIGAQDTLQRSARSNTQRQQELKRVLLDEHMEPIRRMAHADLPRTPELKTRMSVNRGATFQRLLQQADGMAAAAAPYASILVAGGLRADFMDALRVAASELANVMDERITARAQSGSATKSLKTMDTSARRTIAVLDSLIKVDLKHNGVLLNEWNVIKRPRKVAVPAVPAVTPAPVIPPVPQAGPQAT
jgi:hypothetical protein